MPRAIVDYTLGETTLLYASYSVGNPPGGFNTAIDTSTPEQFFQPISLASNVSSEFCEEELKWLEIGLKHGFRDGKRSISVAVSTWIEPAKRFGDLSP